MRALALLAFLYVAHASIIRASKGEKAASATTVKEDNSAPANYPTVEDLRAMEKEEEAMVASTEEDKGKEDSLMEMGEKRNSAESDQQEYTEEDQEDEEEADEDEEDEDEEDTGSWDPASFMEDSEEEEEEDDEDDETASEEDGDDEENYDDEDAEDGEDDEEYYDDEDEDDDLDGAEYEDDALTKTLSVDPKGALVEGDDEDEEEDFDDEEEEDGGELLEEGENDDEEEGNGESLEEDVDGAWDEWSGRREVERQKEEDASLVQGAQGEIDEPLLNDKPDEPAAAAMEVEGYRRRRKGGYGGYGSSSWSNMWKYTGDSDQFTYEYNEWCKTCKEYIPSGVEVPHWSHGWAAYGHHSMIEMKQSCVYPFEPKESSCANCFDKAYSDCAHEQGDANVQCIMEIACNHQSVCSDWKEKECADGGSLLETNASALQMRNARRSKEDSLAGLDDTLQEKCA